MKKIGLALFAIILFSSPVRSERLEIVNPPEPSREYKWLLFVDSDAGQRKFWLYTDDYNINIHFNQRRDMPIYEYYAIPIGDFEIYSYFGHGIAQPRKDQYRQGLYLFTKNYVGQRVDIYKDLGLTFYRAWLSDEDKDPDRQSPKDTLSVKARVVTN